MTDLISHAATQTQMIAITHSPPAELSTIELVKENGGTVVAGRGPPDAPPWHWPKR